MTSHHHNQISVLNSLKLLKEEGLIISQVFAKATFPKTSGGGATCHLPVFS